MRVHQITDAPPPELAAALARFEEQFTYPLGPGRRFRISHGEDYPRFFRAMGEAACFVIQHEGVVLAAIGAAVRNLVLPDGSARPALYLGDLKVTVTARGGYALLELAKAMEPWIRPRAAVGFGIVMDGTAFTPDRYTGRLGIPKFNALAKIVVLRLPTADRAVREGAALREGEAVREGAALREGEAVREGAALREGEASAEPIRLATARLGGPEPNETRAANDRQSASAPPAQDPAALFRDLSAGSFVCPDSNPAERSQIDAQWIIHPARTAIGRLEDTHRAKRLIADDGIEMRSAHLSCFAYRDLSAGVELLHAARRRAARLGFPAMFVAVRAADSQNFIEKLALRDIVAAPATLYGTGIEPGGHWIVNTSEI